MLVTRVDAPPATSVPRTVADDEIRVYVRHAPAPLPAPRVAVSATACLDVHRRPQPARKAPLIPWISWLRVLGIAAVVSIHNSGPGATAARQEPLSFNSLFAVVTDLPYLVAVPLFVMVAGAVALNPARYTTASQYWRKRTHRIVPPLVFWHVFYIGLYFWFDSNFPKSTGQILHLFVMGDVTVHLYFLWIIVGLSAVTPLLLNGFHVIQRRNLMLRAGLLAASLPTVVVVLFGTDGLGWADSPATWWIFFLGLYILGYALREVVLRGAALGAAVLGCVSLQVFFCWQWLQYPTQPQLLARLAPISHTSATTIVAAVFAYLALKSMLRPDGLLRSWVQPPIMKWVNLISGVTLGIYALHLAVQHFFTRVSLFEPAVNSAPVMVLRYGAIVAVTLALVLLMRKIPYLRALV